MGRPVKYPWDDWFAAEMAGVPQHISPRQFDVELAYLQRTALAEAGRRGIGIKTARCKVGHERYSGRLDRMVRVSDDCLRLTVTAASRLTRHDWDALLDGRPHPIWYSELRTIKPDNFVRSLRVAAKQRGMRVTVDRTSNRAGMLVQARR